MASFKKIIIHTIKYYEAKDIVVPDIKKLTNVADCMVICTANSTNHIKTLIEKIREKLELVHIKPVGIESENTHEWVLADFSDVVIYIILEPIRKFYSLEKLWEINKLNYHRP